MKGLEAILDGMDFKGLDFESLKNKSEDEKRVEWLIDRYGRFTGSEFYRLMTYEDKLTLPDGGISYAEEVALEIVTDVKPSNYSNSRMDHGHEYEVEAAKEFMKKYKIVVSNYGEHQLFIKKGEDLGCTPDGLIYDDNDKIEGGIETKCPESKTHVFYVRNVKSAEDLKKHKPVYYWQIMLCMFLTRAKYWYFISYDPRFKNPEKRLHVVKINSNPSVFNKMSQRISQAIKVKYKLISEFK